MKRPTKEAVKPREVVKGPTPGEFIAPPEVQESDERADALPQQEEFWRPPIRFGSVPVEKEPLGWDRRRGFRKLFPAVYLPFQVVERVSFGKPELEPNRLFWGDNLHVMRQLPSDSIDLIYIDPPFFSGREYNVIFGDQNELRSFSDIWEGGMPGYLIWLNARLYEMKRLLKKTGTIYVHCDWHASHYIKVEMDKIFGPENLRGEVIWKRSQTRSSISRIFKRAHDTILMFSKTPEYLFSLQYKQLSDASKEIYTKRDAKGFYRLVPLVVSGIRRGETGQPWKGIDPNTRGKAGSHWVTLPSKLNEYERQGLVVWPKKDGGLPQLKYYLEDNKGVPVTDLWDDIDLVQPSGNEAIGYPTQKPEALLERIILSSSSNDGIVADFFCGGGTAAAVAQHLGRRWIACDQSRVAVALTADRLTRQVEEGTGKLFPVPDFTVEHWGVYEARRLSDMPPEQFRAFIIRCFGAVMEDSRAGFHGMKGAVPVWVGEPNPRKGVTAVDVQDFANAIRRTLRYQQDNLRDGTMLAWAFRQDALEAAERLRRLEQTDLNFIRLDQVRIDSPRFREQVAALTTDHADYENFLTFVQPPKVEVGYKRISARTYRFDVSETVVMNAGAKIINVQWDFDYGERFSSTPGFSFLRGSKKEPQLQVQFEFPSVGKRGVACKAQDDMGGEGLWTTEVQVS